MMSAKKSKKNKNKKKRNTTHKKVRTSLSNEVLDPNNIEEKRPLLSMAMMVKDEEEFLAEALHSVKGLVDELVVVDTGSTDRTVEIAESFGARVSFYPWKQDFSDARNETIRQSRGEWVLILDADERVVIDPKLIPNLRKGLINLHDKKPYIGLSVDVINIRLDGSFMNSLPSLRIFPNTGKLLYKNRVHNQLLPDKEGVELNVNLCDFLKINHLGYDPVVYERRKKSDRSLPLIQKMIEDEPDNMVYRFYEGREYIIKKQHDKALISLEKAVLGMLEGHHGYFAETLKTLLSIYPRLDVDPEKVLIFCDLGIDKHPEQPDFWNFKGYELAYLKRSDEAVECLKKAIVCCDSFELKEVSQSHPIMSQQPWRSVQKLASLLWEKQNYKEAYLYYQRVFKTKPLTEPGWPEILNNICALAIEFNDQDHLRTYFERLLTQPNTQVDMFFFEVERLNNIYKPDEARELLRWGRRRSKRITKDSQFNALCTQLGLHDLMV
jgi:glycosyltransferase involved in cell wall biosynthesis